MHKTKATHKRATAFVGTSGFTYKHWGNGTFYPKGLSPGKWLEFYAGHFNTVELNVTFYRLPAEDTFRSWWKRTPDTFRFAIKGSRFITHVKRLNDCREPLKLYFKRARFLKEKLSVVLWQLPPQFKKDTQRLSDFVRLLKRYKSVRHTFEFRDETWFNEDVYGLLHDADAALCMADWPRYKARTAKIPETASFVYLRRHGPAGGRPYTGCYQKEELQRDARKIRRWLAEDKDIYIYFNNDARGWAARNALDVRRLV